MIFSVKRIYDKDLETKGLRVLIDRLWPRGITKEEASLDLWPKEICPSNLLRKAYHDGELSYEDFAARYAQELADVTIPEALQGEGEATLLTGVRTVEKSHVPTLLAWLQAGQGK